MTTFWPEAGWRLSLRTASHDNVIGPELGVATPTTAIDSSLTVPAPGPERSPWETVDEGCTMTPFTMR